MDKVNRDGVDVSECKYLNKVVNEEPYCNIDEEHLYTCSSDENCYYKQFKRKEQFLKEIEKEITTYRLKYDTTHSASKLLDSLASKIRKELYE